LTNYFLGVALKDVFQTYLGKVVVILDIKPELKVSRAEASRSGMLQTELMGA
jgi:hypothetical protein